MAPLVPNAVGAVMQGPPSGLTTMPIPTGAPTLSFTPSVVPTAMANPVDMAGADANANGHPQHGPVKRADKTPAGKTPTSTAKQTASTATGASSAAAGASSNDANSTSSGSAGGDTYKLYKGDGSSSAGWPSMDKWVGEFGSMWDSNLPLIKKACPSGVPANSDSENDQLKAAIQKAATGAKLDPRFVLAVVMQESKGCVRVPSTKYSVLNPGILQDHEGKNTCNPAISPKSDPKKECTQSDIEGMINDGIFGNKSPGTATGDGYLQVFDQAGSTAKNDEAQQYYIAARLYNSGTEVGNKLECGVATHCYSSDVANRLTGWVNAATKCEEASVSAGCPAS